MLHVSEKCQTEKMIRAGNKEFTLFHVHTTKETF